MAADHSRNSVPARDGPGPVTPAGLRGSVRRVGSGGADDSTSFAATLRSSLAEMRVQNFSALVGALGGKDASDTAATPPGLAGLAGSGAAGVGAPAAAGGVPGIAGLLQPAGLAAGAALGSAGAVGGLSPTGRNLALFDPESAYRMMSLIKQKEVDYKAEYAELHGMGDALATMQQAGSSLAALRPEDGDAAIRSQLARFVSQYNDWVRSFDAAMQPGGLLAGTQAARVARYELRQSIGNPFFGAAEGIRGMAGLGLSIDPATGLAALDSGRLDTALATQRDAALHTVQEFGRNFARSAELLISENNFVSNRLGNLERAIRYIADNKASLQVEFGLGEPAQTTGAVARGLAAYAQIARF